MSDQYYRQRAARRTRFWLLIGLAVLAVSCFALVTANVYRDSCTRSFDRAPRSVVTSFVEAVARGDGDTATRCWERKAFLDLASGCSEICLSRILGTPYQLVDLTLGEPFTSVEGRARITATVDIACPDGNQHSGEILLDGVGAALPWRHWKIIHSTFGGPLSAPWCK